MSYSFELTGVQNGWKCPFCGTVWAPSVLQCCNCGGTTVEVTSTVHTDNESVPCYFRPANYGRWICDNEDVDAYTYKCSECGETIYSRSHLDRALHHVYCGKCGAKMEVEDD